MPLEWNVCASGMVTDVTKNQCRKPNFQHSGTKVAQKFHKSSTQVAERPTVVGRARQPEEESETRILVSVFAQSAHDRHTERWVTRVHPLQHSLHSIYKQVAHKQVAHKFHRLPVANRISSVSGTLAGEQSTCVTAGVDSQTMLLLDVTILRNG